MQLFKQEKMSTKTRTGLLWALTIVITVVSAIYQRSTGPTKPERITVEAGGEEYRFTLRRSHVVTRDLFIRLEDAPVGMEGRVLHRRYPTGEEWRATSLRRDGGMLAAQLPLQPPAGWIEYYLVLEQGGREIFTNEDEPVRLRFRGDVPAMFMIPHILFMFMAMLFSNMTGIMVIFRHPGYRKYLRLTFWTLLVGGLVLGPIIQKYAFGDFWTGWPMGQDLTDNKTLVAFLFWALALYTNRNATKPKPVFALVASIVLLLVYFIPHSMMGSMLDYETGEVVTGFLQAPVYHLIHIW